jgi:hypothetical protein
MTWTIGPGWITTFNPFGSVSFNGSNQYLTMPNNSVFNFGSGAFTVEAWVYCDSSVTTQQCIVTNYGGTTTGWSLQVETGKFVATFSGDGVDILGTTALAINQWYHVAISGATGSIKMFVDGNLDGTYTGATTLNSSAVLSIGRIATVGYMNGYISNLRIVNGVAVYTGAFNVPRAPLQGIQPTGTTNISAITGTQTQLLLQTPNTASFIADSSANNFTLTNNGAATAAALTPFVNGGGAGWEFAGPENGSASFNGSTQYLSRTNDAAFNLPLSSGSVTIEAWIYITSYADSNVVYSVGGVGEITAGRLIFFTNLTTGRLVFVITDTTYLDATGPVVPRNAWCHVALVRSGTTYTVWLNGVSSASAVTASDPTGGGSMRIGRGTSTSTNYFNGFVSNLRLVKGVAVYTDAFTPPIRQLPAVQDANVYGVPSAAITGTQTSLLLNTPNNSQNILDSSTNNFVITNNGSVLPSGISPFVPDLGAVSFNGTNQSLSIATNTAFEFGSGAFTVECWIYPISFNATDGGFMAVGPQDGSATWIFRGSNNGTLTFTFWSAATTVGLILNSGTGIVNLNVWNHLAVTRSGSTFTMWADGVSVATGTSASAISNTGRPARIAYGFASSAIRYQNCYISNVRWVKGVAVYTGAFTPSTQPLPATQSANVYGNPSAAITGTQTSLLLNTPDNAQFIADSSTNAFTVTNNNAALATSLSPFYS